MFPYTDREVAWLNQPRQLSQAEIVARANRLRAEYLGALVAVLARKAAKITEPLARLIERQRMAAELNRMSDRELADIGISRGEIEAVVAGDFNDERVPTSRWLRTTTTSAAASPPDRRTLRPWPSAPDDQGVPVADDEPPQQPQALTAVAAST